MPTLANKLAVCSDYERTTCEVQGNTAINFILDQKRPKKIHQFALTNSMSGIMSVG